MLTATPLGERITANDLYIASCKPLLDTYSNKNI